MYMETDQNAITMPVTILNSSKTSNAPRISGGLISEMYKGATMLSLRKMRRESDRNTAVPYIPIPMPPISRAITSMAKSTAAVCKTDPTVKTITATTIEYFLEISMAHRQRPVQNKITPLIPTLSAIQPWFRAPINIRIKIVKHSCCISPSNAPSSIIAVRSPFQNPAPEAVSETLGKRSRNCGITRMTDTTP